MLETFGNVHPLQNTNLLHLEQEIRNGAARLEAPGFVDESFSFLSKPNLEDHPYCIVLNKPLVTVGAKFVYAETVNSLLAKGRNPAETGKKTWEFTLVEADGKWGLLRQLLGREGDCYLRSQDFLSPDRPSKPLGRVDDLWAAIANEGLALVSTGVETEATQP
jgi:hypothetical protein